MVLLLIPATPLLAQLANNTVTVTASQSSAAQPDEAVFSVTVASGLDKSLDDVVAAVSAVGITATNVCKSAARFKPTSYPVVHQCPHQAVFRRRCSGGRFNWLCPFPS